MSVILRYGLRLGFVVCAAGFAGCSDAKDTEDHIPSQNGGTQPKGSGTLIEAGEACQKLVSAEKQAREKLSCLDPARKCPDYLLPAGGSACFKYDAGSIDACIEGFAKFKSCPDFDKHPCIATAVFIDPCGDDLPSSGGAAGAAGAAGSGGEAAGAAGAAGAEQGGAAGSAGSGGVSGLGGGAGGG